MDAKKLRRYVNQGRQEASKLFPVPNNTPCPDCQHRDVTDRHHLDCNPQNNIDENVIFLCHKCHLRRHRQKSHVGNKSRLTRKQIDFIKASNLPRKDIAAKVGISGSYVGHIRSGRQDPFPIEEQHKIVVPVDWEYKDRRGKPRALSVEQVKEILAIPSPFTSDMAFDLSVKYGVGETTVYHARYRQGVYKDPIYGE